MAQYTRQLFYTGHTSLFQGAQSQLPSTQGVFQLPFHTSVGYISPTGDVDHSFEDFGHVDIHWEGDSQFGDDEPEEGFNTKASKKSSVIQVHF